MFVLLSTMPNRRPISLTGPFNTRKEALDEIEDIFAFYSDVPFNREKADRFNGWFDNHSCARILNPIRPRTAKN